MGLVVVAAGCGRVKEGLARELGSHRPNAEMARSELLVVPASVDVIMVVPVAVVTEVTAPFALAVVAAVVGSVVGADDVPVIAATRRRRRFDLEEPCWHSHSAKCKRQ